MTVKALKKQMAAAIAMTVVSLIALSSSTYAWFASNNVVTATGMTVQAVSEDGIEIAAKSGDSTPADASFATTATATDNYAAKLYPTSTSNLTTWFHASAAAANASTAKAGTYTQLTLTAGNTDSYIAGSTTEKQKATQFYDETGKQYYLVNNFVIRTVRGGTAKDVSVSGITVTGTPRDLDQSVRIALVSGSTKLFYSPVLTADSTLNSVSAISGTGESQTATKDESTVLLAPATADDMDAFLTNVDTTGQEVSIYIYFEGEDTNHYSNAATESAMKELAFTVQFTGVDINP